MTSVVYRSAANAHRVSVEALGDYPDRIDVRSPAEFAHDHIPGAQNNPVLDDIERCRVGSLYATAPFAARKIGAAIVARNIATMLETSFADKSRDWRPLVYCWRGGQRSRALAHILNEIGWRAMQLDGGYRAYRRLVVTQLAAAPSQHRFIVICGLTGSGKSRLLAALADEGAQTLDLEALAQHRGSLLGDLPGDAQPSQKTFETRLLETIGRFDPAEPVYVESESRRIGSLQLPDSVLMRMRQARTLTLRTPIAMRVRMLIDDYRHFLRDDALLRERLAPLAALHGKVMLGRWDQLAIAGEWETLVSELLEIHYDPSYRRSLSRSFPGGHASPTIDASGVSAADFTMLARDALEMASATEALEGQPS